jgi:chaperonin GroEL
MLDENLGARMLREAAERTSDAVGDGTSTATILAHAIYADGLRNIAAGASAIDLKRGLDRGVKLAVEAIRSFSRPVASRKEKSQIATTAHNDATLGELVADAMERVGGEGVVSVEEAKGTETSLEVVEGMQIDRGYLSPYFITDGEKVQAVLEEPLILLYEKKISSLKDLVPLLEQMAQLHKSFLIIAEDVEGEALATLVVNKLRGVLACAAVKAPGYGDRRKAMMGDMAVLTGGHSWQKNWECLSVKISDFGRASRIVIDKDNTTIIGGAGQKEAIAGRCEEIRKIIEKTTSDYDREKLQERLAKLAGGVAVIRVGAPSEAEMKSRKEALEDAISATKAAMAEGIVPGAGLTLLRAIDAIEREEAKVTATSEPACALETGPKPRHARLPRTAAGRGVAGADAGRGRQPWSDASTGKYVDLIETGIIDPTKVVRLALENAVSVASVLLLTEATLTELPEPKSEAARHAGYPEE